MNPTVVVAIAAAAVSNVIVAAILILLYQRYVRRRRKNKIDTAFQQEGFVTYEEFREFGRKVKGLVVHENGHDVLYLKALQKPNFSKFMLKPSSEQEIKADVTASRPRKCEHQEEKDGNTMVKQSIQPNDQPLAIVPALPATPKQPPPPPPPPPPPLPPLPAKKYSMPPAPPPVAGGLVSSLRPSLPPRRDTNSRSSAWGSTGTSVGHMKLKPLHWDKVIANADHSMVWNEIIDGSLRFDDKQIEMLFGYTVANRTNPRGKEALSSKSSSNPSPRAPMFILEPRKSQNTAIVLKSIAISRREILDALLDGHGLTTDTLEKLIRIAPTQEEEAKILQFRGNPSTLADAESFLYHILEALPSAFIRINAMLFRSNYDAEILHLKQSLQALELGCKELRTRGLFLKLLEAILKAGNRMNAGTSRGNAQGFNLTALRKLSDVKSTDGKTTLLHFVVEQVARSEGKRCVLNQNRRGTISNLSSDAPKQAEGDNDYLLLGLQALGRLSTEFSNVKKAAALEHDSFINAYSSLTARAKEIRVLIANCNNGKGGSFIKEMKGFLEECEEELKVVEEEQTRILELVKKTTEYYEAGKSKHERPCQLQLFIIVKDFLHMVDQVRMNISQKTQKEVVAASPESASPPLQPIRIPMGSLDHRLHLVSSDSSWTPSSSESDDDFRSKMDK